MFDREHRDLCHVPRWGILRRSREQNVAEHMYFVAIYAFEIATYIGWQGDYVKLFRVALTHDMPEVWTGDTPGPVKRVIEDKAKLRDFENRKMAELFPLHADSFRPDEFSELQAIIRVADRLEATMFLADEFNMGNKSVGDLNVKSTPLGANYARLTDAVEDLVCPLEVKAKMDILVRDAVINAMDGLSRIVTD